MYKHQLQKEFGEKWVAALRSGDYQQTTNTYYDSESDCYCMLGVGYKANGVEFNEHGRPISGSLLIISNGLFEEIKTMNDVFLKDFETGANWIEANVEFIEGEVSHV